MRSIQRADPRGRLDVLAYRIVERLALRQCPREWPAIKPFVEAWAKKALGPRRPRKLV